MLYQAALMSHILTVIVTGAAIAYTLYTLRFNVVQMYRSLALLLGFIAAFEVFSGTVLAFLSPELSAAALSLHIIVYLGVCVAAEALLFARMQKISLVFPMKLTTSPVFLSICLFIAAASTGF